MKHLVLLLVVLSLSVAGWGETEEYLNAPPECVDAWRELKFGLFIHWGPVSLKGTEIGWSRGGERRGTGGTGQIPVEVYDNLYKEFNPTKFDADEWVRIAKESGMKYLVFTSKHHDGFVNFDSKLTDYKITSPESPYGKDIVKQLADACHKGGLEFGFYYSPPDWHHPDYRTENHGRYIEYLHGQLKELCSNYGKISMIFFDGLGGTAEDWNAKPLFKMIRGLQPDVVINNRCGLPADNETPEQKIGAFQSDPPWETCMTIGTQWAWKPDDKIKSLNECIQTLARTVGNDGNLLFNVGPMPDGRIEPRQVERLKEMGDWLQEFGESIYATRGGPIKSGPWGVTTMKDDKVFVHVLDWEGESLTLPSIKAKILDSRFLKGGNVEVVESGDGITIVVPEKDRHPIDTVIVLKVDRAVKDIPMIAR